MCVLSIKVPIRKKSGNLFNDPRILGAYNCNLSFLQPLDFSHAFFPTHFQDFQL